MRISDWSSDVCSSDLGEHGIIGLDLAIGRDDIKLARDPEARKPFERDQITAVIGLGALADPAKPADFKQGLTVAIIRIAAGARLDHADQPDASHRIANHRTIARVEEVKRKADAWKKQCARKQ